MTAVNANAKQLAAIEAVASKVNATETELNALAERTTRQAVALCVALWRHTCRSRAATPVNVADPAATTDADDDYVLVGDSGAAASEKASENASEKQSHQQTQPQTQPQPAPAAPQRFAVDTAALRRAAYDLRMGTHWRDEALMQQLFALDNVFGDDQVKAKRKEQVTRIKALIARAEQLRIRNRRLDALLKRLPQPPAAATAEAEPVSPTPSASAAADGEVKYAEPAALAAAAAAAAAATNDAAAGAAPMETDAQPAAAAAAAAPRAVTPPPPAPASAPAAAPKSPALTASALDVKHAPEQAAAIAAAAAPAKAASRPATPEKEKKAPAAAAAAAAAPSRPATPPKAAPAAAAAAAGAAAGAAEDDSTESGGFVIPAKVKAQWPRLRAEFDTRDAGDSIHLSAALPGVLPQDLGVSLSADNSVLTVRGLKRPQPPQQRVRRAAPFGGWFGSAYDYEEDDAEAEEDDFGWFEEQFSIPARLGVDATKAERVFRGGRLTIVLPRKVAPQPQPQFRAPRCAPAYAPAYAPAAQPQYYYRQPQPSPFAAFGGHPFFGGRTGGWF